MNKIVEKFNDYNVSLRLKDACTPDDNKNDARYFGHVEEYFLKLKDKIS